MRYNTNVMASSSERHLPEGWPEGIPYGEVLPEARAPEPGELQRKATRLLRLIDQHPRRAAADLEPLEDDPVPLNQLMANLGRTLREREERRRHG